jgi:hypothetical protein
MNRWIISCYFWIRFWRHTNRSILWQKGWFQFLHCKFPLPVQQYFIIACIWCLSRSWFDMQELVLHTISFWLDECDWQTHWCYRGFSFTDIISYIVYSCYNVC